MEESLYTWKDAQGGLHITDARPPAGAEVLEVSPSNVKAVEEVHRQRRIQQERILQERIREEKIRQERERGRIEKQVAVEKEEAARREKAEEIEK